MRLLRAAIAAALLCSSTLATAQVVRVPQVINSGGSSVPGLASVLIDSSGAEKGTSANPLVVTGGGGGGSGGGDPSWTAANGSAPTGNNLGLVGGWDGANAHRFLTDSAGRSLVTIYSMPAITGSVSITGTPSVGVNNFPASFGVSSLPALPAGSNAIGSITQPDVFASGTIASGTANAAYTAAIANGAGVAGFTVTGLTASGATLAIETSNDGGTTWSAANGAQGSTGMLFQTVTADGQFRVNVGGRKAVRLRVAATGSGTINVTSNVSLASTEVGMSSPLPPGLNTIGTVNSPANGTPGTTAPGTAGQVAGVGPNGNLRAVATDTRGALQPAQVSYLDSTAVAVGTTAVQIDSDVLNSGSSIAMTTAQRGARIGITVQNAGAATTSDIFLCFGGQGANCSSTNYTYRLASGFGAGSLFLPLAAPGVPVYAIGAAASAGTIKVSSQVAL